MATCIRRRDFATLIGGAAAWPFATLVSERPDALFVANNPFFIDGVSNWPC